MSKISKTAAASMRGGPVEAKKDPFDTNEKKIQELRNQRVNKLFPNRVDFIDALIESYDAARTLNVSLLKQVADTEDRNGVLTVVLDGRTKEFDAEREIVGVLAKSNEALLKRAEEAEAQLAGLRRTLSEAANTGDGSYRP
jgi:hypothetical protein